MYAPWMTRKLSELSPEQQAKQRASSQQYKLKNKSRDSAYGAAYHKRRYATEPAYRERKDASAQRARVKRLYGLTEAAVAGMLGAQDYRCEICSSELAKYHIDHCHKTGKVRALLCPSCNIFLGKIEACPVRLQSALDYVERHQKWAP